MKNLILIFGLILLASSCTEDETIPVLICEGDCLFSREAARGVVSFTECYQHWSITFDEDSLVTLMIDPPIDMMEEDTRVEVDATFFTNDIRFLLPDPPGPIPYKSDILDYTILN